MRLDIANIEENPVIKWTVVVAAFSFGAALFVWFFTQLNTDGNSFGIDLIFYAFRDWNNRYDIVNGLRNPPWSVLVLVPFGAMLPDTVSWGLLAYATLIGLIVSVPSNQAKWRVYLFIVLIVTAFPTLRVVIDAQLEILVIGGILATVYGLRQQNPYILAVGSLFATAKPQAISMLMPLVSIYIYMLLYWPRNTFLQAVGLVCAVVIPTMIWRGEDWIAAIRGTYQAGSLIDISLMAALNRLDMMPETLIYAILVGFFLLNLWIIWISDRTISREKAALLSAASMLLASYTAANSVLIILTVGILSLMQRRFIIGFVVFMIGNSFFYFNRPENAEWIAYFWTTYVIGMWLLLAWDIYRVEIRTKSESPLQMQDNQQPALST